MHRLPYACALFAAIAMMPAQDPTAAWFAKGPIPELQLVLTDDAIASLRQEPRKYVRAELRETGGSELRVSVKLKGSAGSFRDVDDRPGFTVEVRGPGESDFHGLVKFHLNNGVQDETLLQEGLAYEVFRRAGLPAPLVTHARVFLGERDLGLYVLKEGYDERFAARHLGGVDGNLYDGGTNGEVYDDLERDAGKGPLDRADLKALAAACGEGDAAARKRAVAACLDVDRFLSFMAVEVMICHWDGYTQNPNNYRIWFDREHRATFVPHGADQVFVDPQAALFDKFAGRVAQVVWSDAEWRAALRKRVKTLLPLFDPPDVLINWVRERAARLRPHAPELERSWRDLEQRITERARYLADAVERPEPKPFVVGPGGAALGDLSWRVETQCDDVVLERLGEPEPRLRIAAGGCGECVGSFRTKVLLPAGRYELRADMTMTGVVAFGDEGRRGAGVRISGGERKEVYEGTGERAVVFAFEVDEPLRQVVLVVELRATKGEVVFPLSSLRLVPAK
ncbi:MAG TPA: CotH kinase family protein [Planctomycetota bacterium]|nr:CotH kinase family protein [Planctomycetota bacterium]